MKNTLMKRLTLVVLTLAVITTMTACGRKAGPQPSAPSATPTTGPQAPTDLLAKYDPAITLTAWRFLNNGIQFAEGDTIEDNVWIDYYKERFGINLEYDWVVPEDQWEQKMNIAVATGNLPDIMWLNNKSLIDLAENDMLYDLTELYKNNTSDFTKSILEQDITSFNTAKIDGKLMAIPHTGSAIDQLQILYVRTDWLQNLGLQMPKNMEELLAVAKAFKERDPDKNNANDTIGLAITKGFIQDNHFGLTGFFAGYHGYLRRWVDDGSGNLVYGSIQPQIKTGLARLQKMYKDGLLDPEFGVKDRAKVQETVASGKVGVMYGGMSTPGSVLKFNAVNDPKAEWQAIELVSTDDKPAKPITKMPVTRYYAVSKDSKYPEALMKLIENGSAGYSRESKQTQDEWTDKLSHVNGIAVWQYALTGYEHAKKNLIAHQNVIKAPESGDTSILNTEEQGYYDRIKLHQAGDRNYYGDERIFGTPSSFDIIQKYVDSGNYLYDAFYGSMTPTMVEKKASLDAMEEEIFTRIIVGESVDLFDKFVQDWKNLGGDQITKEVNEWYGPRK
jgi:putative aldouronate transport system substrate-binding protein